MTDLFLLPIIRSSWNGQDPNKDQAPVEVMSRKLPAYQTPEYHP